MNHRPLGYEPAPPVGSIRSVHSIKVLVTTDQGSLSETKLTSAEVVMAEKVVLKETTVGVMGTVSVGMGNMWDRTYTEATGAEKKGLTAMLFVEDADGYVVGLDSQLDIGGRTWRVVGIEKKPHVYGTVTLAPLP